MGYIVAVIVFLWIVWLVIKLAWTILKIIFSFIKKHAAIVFSVTGFLIISSFWGTEFGVFAVIVGVAIKGGVALFKKLQIAKMRSNERRLWNWLQKKAGMLGLTDYKKVKIPAQFAAFRYTAGKNHLVIIQAFLEQKNLALAEELPHYIYDLVKSAGMGEEEAFEKIAEKDFEKHTRTETISQLFATAVSKLEKEGKIDRPDRERKTIHCIGSAGGANFESVEIELDI